MQVTGINSYTYSNSNYKPSFKGWTRSIYPVMEYAGVEVPMYDCMPIYRNNTWFFRNNNEIPKIMDGLVKINNDVSHVNTLIYGCSNGSESSSMYMYLAANYEKDILSKFLPFKAFDIDKTAISIAKRGRLPVDYDEFFKIQIFTNNKFNEFFDGQKAGIPNGVIDIFKPHQKLKRIFNTGTYYGNSFEDNLESGKKFNLNKKHAKNIKYSVSDIMKDCENFEPVRTFLSTRNMLPYLNDNEILKLFKTLGKRLPQNSCIALASYDLVAEERAYSFDINTVIKDNGFSNKNTGSEFLFKKL